MESRELCFGLLEDREFRIGGLPEVKEVLVGGSRFRLISHKHEGESQLSPRRGLDRISLRQAGMRKKPCELRGGVFCPIHCQISKAAYVQRVHVAVKMIEGQRRYA